MLSEDPEIAKIMQKKLEAMINQKPQPKVEPGIIDLNDSNFEQTISSENLTLVDFWAEWCGPCKALAPVLDEIADEYEGKITIAKVNVDENVQLPPKYGIRGIPTMLLFKDGAVQATKVGALSKANLNAFLDSNI